MKRHIIAIASALALGASSQAHADDAQKSGAKSQSPYSQSQSGSSDHSAHGGSSGSSASQQGQATPAPSRGSQQGQQARASGGQSQKAVIGTVESIEEDKIVLKSRRDQAEHSFKLNESTKFRRGGQEISRDDVSEGDQVRAAYTGQGDQRTATEIKVQGAKSQRQSSSGAQGSQEPTGSAQGSPQGSAGSGSQGSSQQSQGSTGTPGGSQSK